MHSCGFDGFRDNDVDYCITTGINVISKAYVVVLQLDQTDPTIFNLQSASQSCLCQIMLKQLLTSVPVQLLTSVPVLCGKRTAIVHQTKSE